MAILGKAIASYLRNRSGLYSVELPPSLFDEMCDVVAGCNQVGPNRAFLVTEQPASGSTFPVIRWAEILRWRTQDDRVFVWARGSREPDTSFRSVVRPFIANRFPGINGGECTLDELARFTIAEVWSQRNFSKGSDAYLAFAGTASWVSGLLRESFEEAGSTPSVHWSDRFLEHWAGVVRQLDTALAVLTGPPLPRYAWELLRLAGIPVPAQLAGAGNPFLQPPSELSEREWRKLAKFWQEVVDEFIIPEGAVAVLLSALDRQVAGAGDVSSWRGLPWTTTSRLSSDTPAPIVGSAVFATGSLSMLSPTAPPYPITRNPCWWGVTTDHLQKAIAQLQGKKPLQPSPSCTAIVQGQDPTQIYWLLTRQGTLSAAHTARKWRARLNVVNLELVFKEEWRQLFVSPLAPNSPEDGDAWINPDEVKVEVTGRSAAVLCKTVSVAAGNQLTIGFDLAIEFTANREKSTGTVSGSWDAERLVKLTAKVSHYLNGGWTAPQEVDSALHLIIPSPFSPTLAASARQFYVAPDSTDSYTANSTTPNWAADSTPDIILPEEGRYQVTIYDGRVATSGTSFVGPAAPTVDGRPVTADLNRTGMFTANIDLDDGDLFCGTDTSTFEIAVVKVKERSTNLSSGLLSALRGTPAGRRKPSEEARKSFLGRYQAEVVGALARQLPQRPNSLYQYVASSAESVTAWPSHRGTPAPEFLFGVPTGWIIPGIHSGPSSALATSPAWCGFMDLLQKVCAKIGIDAGASEFWLSGFDPTIVGLELVRDYVAAHLELMRTARSLSSQDRFWASYPLSVVIVEGRAGASFGQLLAVLLSPLHPVRLAWSGVLATVARFAATDLNLLGIAEGWNFPTSGLGVSPAGQELPMLAVPTDPGVEKDFAAWSALAVLTTGGLVELPPSAAGLPLPWGGRTGVNERVVEQAIKDYLAANPHLNALELDIRSVSPAPRSREIDEAVLALVGTGALDQVTQLGGATRIWDSTHREGKGPTRDRLFVVREENEGEWPFEWRRYTPPDIPKDSDLAFVENASVHIAVTGGSTHGVIGTLPLRRFLPSVVKDLVLDQNFSAQSGDDIIGLSALLAELEYPAGPNPAALHASPQPSALGIGLGARWEVLGTFNIDPSLLSSLVASTSEAGKSRLLWEWRPSWLSRDQKGGELAKRPYYVVAKTPTSMIRALEYVQGLTPAQGAEMLSQLGRSGIGLASLYATGGTHESAAAGFFYALRLIVPPLGHPLACDWPPKDGCLGVLPIDPIEPILAAAAGQSLTKRCDLLVIRVAKSNGQPTEICLIPIEIKHRGTQSNPEPLPGTSDTELKYAREQLAATASALDAFRQAIAVTPSDTSGLLAFYMRRLSLGVLMELALSFAPLQPAAGEKAAILRDVVNGTISVGLGDPILLWFAPGSVSSSGSACIVDPNGTRPEQGRLIREVFVDPSAIPGIWWTGHSIGPDEREVRSRVDAVCRSASSRCGSNRIESPGEFRERMAHALGVTSPPETVIPTVVEPPQPESPAPASQSEPSIADTMSKAPKHEVPPPEPLLQPAEPEVPRCIIGWTAPTSRWSFVGHLDKSAERVALDLDHPKAVGIFGYMGSGKSYLLGTLVEAAVMPIPGINVLPAPLAVVVFNYRRNASDRFELGSLSEPNRNEADVQRLRTDFGASPLGVPNIHVLGLPGELTKLRLAEYGRATSSELFFSASDLTVEDWELLMGEPGSEAVFARTIRHALIELRSARTPLTLDRIEHHVSGRLTGQSRTAAQLRFEFVHHYISAERGVDFQTVLQPGRVLVVDLRQPLFNKSDALRFFLVCANQVSRVQGRFNKLVVFDEAHEYLSDEFGERIEARIRQMRHEGTSYAFATQDVGSIPLAIRRFITTRFVFSLGTRENVDDLSKFAPEFTGHVLLGMPTGSCLVQSNLSSDKLFDRPRLVSVRPRVTQHGGATRIFTRDDL